MTTEKEAQLFYQKVEHHENSIRILISTVREQTTLLENQQNMIQDKTSCEKSMAIKWSKKKAHTTQMEIWIDKVQRQYEARIAGFNLLLQKKNKMIAEKDKQIALLNTTVSMAISLVNKK